MMMAGCLVGKSSQPACQAATHLAHTALSYNDRSLAALDGWLGWLSTIFILWRVGRHWDYLRSVLVAALASAPISKQNVEKHILTAVNTNNRTIVGLWICLSVRRIQLTVQCN